MSLKGANTDPIKLHELLTRGVCEVIHADTLKQKLQSGRRLRVKLGVDPTSEHIHLGRTIPLLKLRDFQELGHQIVFIVGDFTGQVGDTSDKDSERPMLTREVVKANLETYKAQVGRIIDFSNAEFRYNSEWLEPLTYREISEHADQFSIADFIARDNIKRRLAAGKRVSLRETLYPLLQGYDSIAVKADVEIGGTDQRFNLLAGRTLQEHFGQTPQDIVMNPLVNGLDGRKMSSSWGNTITITMSPDEMYGKVMSMRDEEIVTYLRLCTRVPLTEIVTIEKDLKGGMNPRDAKMYLAREIVSLYYGKSEANESEIAFKNTYQNKQIPEEMTEIRAPYVEGMIEKGIIASKAELRRLLEGKGVHSLTTGKTLTEIPALLNSELILRLGKRRFVKLIPE